MPRLEKTQQAKLILMLNFIALFIIVVLTPKFVRIGIWNFSEAAVEGFFLAIELIAIFVMFRHYDELMVKKEEEALLLGTKLQDKERELLEAFQYLGKVNVQISMIKNIFEKMKVPSTKAQLKEIYMEFLRIVSSVTGEKCAGIRIVNLESRKTLNEFYEKESTKKEVCDLKIKNVDLIKNFEKDQESQQNNYSLFYSKSENFSVKAFIFVSSKHKQDYTSEEKKFLEALANQCEITFLLFSSQYYRAR